MTHRLRYIGVGTGVHYLDDVDMMQVTLCIYITLMNNSTYATARIVSGCPYHAAGFHAQLFSIQSFPFFYFQKKNSRGYGGFAQL